MAKIVGIKFNHSSKVYYFDPGKEYYEKGCGVIVETARGTEYGKVVIDNDVAISNHRQSAHGDRSTQHQNSSQHGNDFTHVH